MKRVFVDFIWIRIIRHQLLCMRSNLTNMQEMQPTDYLSYYEEIKMPKVIIPNPEEYADIIKEMKYKDGDVLICAYPKSGNNWTETLIRALLRKDKSEHILAKPSIIDLCPPEVITSMQSPRVLFTHLWPKRLPKEHVEKRGKMLLVLRNPKDIVVSSFYHYTRDEALKYTKTWNEHFDAFVKGEVFFGDIFSYLQNWEAAVKAGTFDLKQIFYEDLHLKPVETLRNIAEHIGVTKTIPELEEILGECTIENRKKMVDPDKIVLPLIDENNEHILLRKGEIGDWKNHFTVAQAERFDEILQEKLEDSMFEFMYDKK